MNLRIFQTILSFSVFLLFSYCATTSNENAKEAGSASSIVARGESFVVNGNVPAAKQKALNDAFKNAVQQAVGVYIKTQSNVENFELTYSKILESSEGYISTYKITQEKQTDNVYMVEINATVSDDKLESAFSQRIAKFIENNLVGPGSIDINYQEFEKVAMKKSVYITIFAMINDPTIKMDSIMVKLPKSGWVKPKVMSMGTINSLTIGGNAESYKLLADAVSLLENHTAKVKLINPATQKTETRDLIFDKFSNCMILKDGKDIVPRPTYMQRFSEVDRGRMRQIIKYLKNAL
jgi:hypothetical protein